MNKRLITVIGSINMDVVVRSLRHPKPGETVMGEDVHFIPGGKGSNQAVAASRLGGNVRMIGKLGNDSFGNDLHKFLDGEKLDTTYVTRTTDVQSGTALITVNDTGENTIVVVPGSNHALIAEEAEKIDIQPGEILVAQFETPFSVIKAFFAKAKEAGATTILNPAPAADIPKEFLQLSDYIIVNETELAFFSKTSEIFYGSSEAGELASSLRVREEQVVVVTMGSKGAVAIQGNEILQIPSYKVKVVDTTGAGDCFVGAFAVALSEGKDLRAALEFANVAASISVERLGASASLPKREEVESRLSEERKKHNRRIQQ